MDVPVLVTEPTPAAVVGVNEHVTARTAAPQEGLGRVHLVAAVVVLERRQRHILACPTQPSGTPEPVPVNCIHEPVILLKSLRVASQVGVVWQADGRSAHLV